MEALSGLMYNYDGDEDILTLNLYEDIEKGDLDFIT